MTASLSLHSMIRHYPKNLSHPPLIPITHPTLKKTGRPPPIICRPEKFPVGPIIFKTGRGDLQFSSTKTCVSTEVSDGHTLSVRSFSKLVGPADRMIRPGAPPPPHQLKVAPMPSPAGPQKCRSVRPIIRTGRPDPPAVLLCI
jgi:hypothetical protein